MPNTKSFILCLWYQSDNRIRYKLWLLTIYILFAVISIIPLFIDAIDHDFFGPRDSAYRKWAEALFSGWHLLFVNPIVTALGLVTYFCQARVIRSLPIGSLKALSLLGLLIQGVVFIVVAISWTMRVKFMEISFGEVFSHGAFWSWYQMVGWAAVDNAIFALVQISLFLLARNWGVAKTAAGESEPLLRSALE